MTNAVTVVAALLAGAAFAWSGDACVARAGTATSPANWSDPSTWRNCQGRFPGNGDTALIGDFVVSVSGDVTIGTGGQPLWGYVESATITGQNTCAGFAMPAIPGNVRPIGVCTVVSGAPVIELRERGVKLTSTTPATTYGQCKATGGGSCQVEYVAGGGPAAVWVSGSTGQLIVDGATLSAKGTIYSTSTAPAAIELRNGGRLVNAGPLRYGLTADTGASARGAIYAHCAAERPCAIDGFRIRNENWGPNLDLRNVVIANAGGLEPAIRPTVGANQTLSLVDTIFRNSGAIYAMIQSGSSTFVLDHVVATGTQSPCSLEIPIASADVLTGARLIRNTVFDRPWCGYLYTPYTSLKGFTVQGNYLAGAALSPATWQLWENNFVRLTRAPWSISGRVADSYLFWDPASPVDNPHITWPSSPVNATGLVLESGIAVPIGDSGEWVYPDFSKNEVWTLQNSFVLPGPQGRACCELTAMGASAGQLYLYNNVINMGWESGGLVGVADINESGITRPGTLRMVGNIFWSESIPYLKIATIAHPSALNGVDVCPAELCDYNLSRNARAVTGACAACQNQANGYEGNYTGTPGANDVSGEPMFVDYKRGLALWDTQYYCNHNRDACSSYNQGAGPSGSYTRGAEYSVGDIVTYPRPGDGGLSTYWGLPVSYRCIQAGCGNVPPGDTGRHDLNRVLSMRRGTTTLVSLAGRHDLQPGDLAVIMIGATAPSPTPSSWNALGGQKYRVTACADCEPSQFRMDFDSSTFPADMAANKAVVYNDWKSYWEFASLDRMRRAIAGGERFRDPALLGYRQGPGPAYTWVGCDRAPGGCNAVAALVGWIRAGYRSSNPQTQNACRAAVCTQPDIGAAPFLGAGRPAPSGRVRR